MKKIRNLPESQFLKLFFAFVTVCFLIAAVCLPDRNQAFAGLWRIFSSTCRITTNYFAVGGFSATFLNMGSNAKSLAKMLFVRNKAKRVG